MILVPRKFISLLFTALLAISFGLSCVAATQSNTQSQKLSTEAFLNKYRTMQTVSRGGLTFLKCINMSATAYTAKQGARTASGLTVGEGKIAVDRRIIPLGTKLYVASTDGSKDYGFAVASDTGGAIKNNKIDVFFNTYSKCIQFGRRNVKVYILSQY